MRYLLGDALNTISALFHDAAAADGHVRIAHELELRCLPILEKKKLNRRTL